MTKTILVAGAGKSTIYLIDYLLSNAQRYKWKIIIADGNAAAIAEKIMNNKHAEAAVIDISNNTAREQLVQRADLVISLMPAHLHILLAKDCLKHKKNLITSSYISDEIKAMSTAVKDAGLMFMCEMGLDPGLDHMTASQIIHSIQRVAAIITSFKSYCGGLVAPEDDDNPWHYKFSWNPRNIVTAGKAGASYLQNGKEVDVSYNEIFLNNKKIKVEGVGSLAYYPNRDSMHYIDSYGIPEVKNFMRATLRHATFCKGWQAVVDLDLTNEQDHFDTKGKTYASWIKEKTGSKDGITLSQHIAQKLNLHVDDKTINMLRWLGVMEDKPLKEKKTASSADILLDLLLEKWAMQPDEKDMVVMQHEIEYIHRDKKITLTSSMAIKGDNREHSAMAKTVGLPIAILAKLVLTDKINPPKGVLIPNMPSVYRPILTELNHYGISFTEEIA